MLKIAGISPVKYYGVLAAVLALAVFLVSLIGCSQKNHGTQDSPVNQQYTDNTPAQILNFPDGFFNVAEKCDHHGNMVYSNTRSGASPIAVPDPKCPYDWPTG